MVIVSDANTARKIASALVFDKRDDGARGRRVTRAMPEYNLKVNDRLEPSPNLLDTGDLESSEVYPIIVTFWRPSMETCTRHRNPIIDPEIGVTIQKSVAIDELHTLRLGVIPRFNVRVFWAILLSNCFGVRNGSTQDEILLLGVRHMKIRLWDFYKTKSKEVQKK
eukprot:7909186-Karenia_brevis.AAC.1